MFSERFELNSFVYVYLKLKLVGIQTHVGISNVALCRDANQ